MEEPTSQDQTARAEGIERLKQLHKWAMGEGYAMNWEECDPRGKNEGIYEITVWRISDGAEMTLQSGYPWHVPIRTFEKMRDEIRDWFALFDARWYADATTIDPRSMSYWIMRNWRGDAMVEMGVYPTERGIDIMVCAEDVGSFSFKYEGDMTAARADAILKFCSHNLKQGGK